MLLYIFIYCYMLFLSLLTNHWPSMEGFSKLGSGQRLYTLPLRQIASWRRTRWIFLPDVIHHRWWANGLGPGGLGFIWDAPKNPNPFHFRGSQESISYVGIAPKKQVFELCRGFWHLIWFVGLASYSLESCHHHDCYGPLLLRLLWSWYFMFIAEWPLFG